MAVSLILEFISLETSDEIEMIIYLIFSFSGFLLDRVLIDT